MNIFSRSDSFTKSNKPTKCVTKTPNSLQRRRSLKSLKTAKLKFLKKSVNEKHQYIGDRIMAHRAVMNFDDIETAMNRCYDNDNLNKDDFSVPNMIDKVMRPSGKRIIKLTLNHKSPSADEKLQNLIQNKKYSKPKLNRQISVHPERVLDAPEVSDEYMNIIDWGKNNIIAVALKQTVYLWEATVGRAEELMSYSEDTLECVSCVKWCYSDNYRSADILAIGSSFGNIFIWDISEKRVVRHLTSDNCSEIMSLALRDYTFSVGLKSGVVEHHDIRYEMSLICANRYHTQTIRHLKWSCNQEYLAVVSHGSCATVWSSNTLGSSPVAVFPENVTDVAWSPKDSKILLCCCADNGGMLKLFDVISKSCIKVVGTEANILCLYWSDVFDEVAVASVESNEACRIKILHDDTFSAMYELFGHKGHIIAMVPNPSGEVIASLGHDEQIRLWNCFQNQEIKKLKSRKNQRCSFLRDMERFR